MDSGIVMSFDLWLPEDLDLAILRDLDFDFPFKNAGLIPFMARDRRESDASCLAVRAFGIFNHSGPVNRNPLFDLGKPTQRGKR